MMDSSLDSNHCEKNFEREVDQRCSLVGNTRRWPRGFKSEIKHRVLYFTPAWYTVNMATGMVSVLLHNLPWQFHGLSTISTIVFVLNLFLFLLFLLTTIARYIIWPQLWSILLDNPIQSLFIGTFSMGLSTLVTAAAYICVPVYGLSFLYFIWSIWWIVVVLAISSTIGIPYLMFTRHVQTEPISFLIIQPIVAPVIGAACGSVVAELLPPREALITVVVCYLLLGLSVPPTLWSMALYYQRLIVHKIPIGSSVITMFLGVGPCGQTAFSLIKLSDVLRKNLAAGALESSLYSSTEIAASIAAIHGVSLIISIFMIGLGSFLLLIATTATFDTLRKGGIPYNLGFFGLVFPIGTMATSTLLVYEDLNIHAFRVVSMVLSVVVIGIWCVVFTRAVYESFTGKIFVDSCIPLSGEPPPRRKRKDEIV